MKLILFFLLILLFGCKSKPDQTHNSLIESNDNDFVDSLGFLTPRNMTLTDFLNIIEFKEYYNTNVCSVTIQNDFPSSWLDSSDIYHLITLVDSKEKCFCFKDPKSSYIPFEDSSDLGGYAIKIINAFRLNENIDFGLNSCPKTNEKDVKELKKWWASLKQKE